MAEYQVERGVYSNKAQERSYKGRRNIVEGEVITFKLREMEREQIERYGLTKYIKEEENAEEWE